MEQRQIKNSENQKEKGEQNHRDSKARKIETEDKKRGRQEERGE